jgi:beta-galactosidase
MMNLPDLEEGKEYFLQVSSALKESSPLLPVGHEVATGEFPLTDFIPNSFNTDAAQKLSVTSSDDVISVVGQDFMLKFDQENGQLFHLDYGFGNLVQGPIRPNFWRAPTDNDYGFGMPKVFGEWKKITRQPRLKEIKVTGDGENNSSTIIETTFSLNDADAHVKIDYTINGNGDILVTNHISGIADLPKIPRLGNNVILHNKFNYVSWYGRGPHENYQDRKTGSLVDLYSCEVKDLMYPYIRPQENGNRTDTRWVKFLNKNGQGVKFLSVDKPISFSAHHQLNSDFDEGDKKIQRHTYQIPNRKLVNVNIDYMQMGVGGDNSWGYRPLDQYMIEPTEYTYSFIIKGKR